MQASIHRFYPGVGLAVGHHPHHVRTPQFQAGVAGRQDRGAVRGKAHARVGVAAAGRPPTPGRPVNGAHLAATAIVAIDGDGVVIHPANPAQVGVAGVAPQHLSRGGVTSLYQAPARRNHCPTHRHGDAGAGARCRPKLSQGSGDLAGRGRTGRRNGGGAADRGTCVAGPPDQRRDRGGDKHDPRGGQ